MKDKIKKLIKSGEHEDMIDCAISELIWIAENFSEAKSTPIDTLNKLHDIGFEMKRIATTKKKPVDMSVFVDYAKNTKLKSGSYQNELTKTR